MQTVSVVSFQTVRQYVMLNESRFDTIHYWSDMIWSPSTRFDSILMWIDSAPISFHPAVMPFNSTLMRCTSATIWVNPSMTLFSTGAIQSSIEMIWFNTNHQWFHMIQFWRLESTPIWFCLTDSVWLSILRKWFNPDIIWFSSDPVWFSTDWYSSIQHQKDSVKFCLFNFFLFNIYIYIFMCIYFNVYRFPTFGSASIQFDSVLDNSIQH